MKFFINSAVAIILIAMFFSSCSNSGNEGKMIPKDALVVVHFNTKSLLSKLSWDDIKQTSWFREMYDDSSKTAWTTKLLSNPENTGIDFKSDLIIFIKKSESDNGQLVLEGDVKDAKAFEEFNKNIDASATAAKDGDLIMLTLKNHALVGWNDKKFIYIANAPSMPNRKYFDYDSLSAPAPALASVVNLPKICKGLFSLKEDSSLKDDKRFNNLLKESGDIHFWQNTEQLVKNSPALGALGMLKLDLFLQGNIVTATGNFDNGKIDIEQKFYAGKELNDLLRKYGGGKINTDMIKNIPSDNIAGLIALHFKPEGIKEIIKLTGMDGLLNMFIAKQGMTLDDFIKANAGDILFAATDFSMKKDSFNFNNSEGKDSSFTYDKPDVNYLFAASIGDKPSFDKLFNTGKRLGDNMGNSKLAYQKNEKYFVAGNNKSALDKYISGNNTNFPFLDKLSNHPVAGFIDLQKIFSATSSISMKDSAAKVLMNESEKIWNNIYFMGGEYKDDGFIMNTEINLADKNTNSLKQLNKYFDSVSKIMHEEQKKYKEKWATADMSLDSLSHIDTVGFIPSH